MERRLLLTSTGVQPADYQHLRSAMGNEKMRLGIIPNACPDWQSSRQVEIVQERFANATRMKILDLKVTRGQQLKGMLLDSNVVYVCGGSIFHLLELSKKSGFVDYVQMFVSRGGMYVGVSAGSMIAGPNIELATIYPSFTEAELTTNDFTGFSLTETVIVPHFDNSLTDSLSYFARRTRHQIAVLPKKQSMAIHNGNTTFIGNGYFFNANQTNQQMAS